MTTAKVSSTRRSKDKPIRVFLVDPHPIFREGVRSRLSDPEFAIVGEAGSGGEAIAAALRARPEVVLLDLVLPDLPGSDVCTAILERLPDAAVIVLSALTDSDSVRGAFDAGARAFLVKDATDLDLPDAIRRALRGESIIHPRAAFSLLGGLGRRSPESPMLSQQEIKVLQLVAQGLTNREIGARLYLSRHTVKEYLGHAMRKLDASSRVAAVLEAHGRGLIELPSSPQASKRAESPRGRAQGHSGS